MNKQAQQTKWTLPTGFIIAVGVVILLGVTAPAFGHRPGGWARAEQAERALDARPAFLMTICNGLGRAQRPALPPHRRFRHFGCVIFDSRGRTLCAVVHILQTGRLEVGRLWNGLDPGTPPRACGVR
jgi:hypothetical protein